MPTVRDHGKETLILTSGSLTRAAVRYRSVTRASCRSSLESQRELVSEWTFFLKCCRSSSYKVPSLLMRNSHRRGVSVRRRRYRLCRGLLREPANWIFITCLLYTSDAA